MNGARSIHLDTMLPIHECKPEDFTLCVEYQGVTMDGSPPVSHYEVGRPDDSQGTAGDIMLYALTSCYGALNPEVLPITIHPDGDCDARS